MSLRAPVTRVLLVEDEEPIRRFLVTTLEAEGYEVFEAANALEGETLAGNRRIDVFLVDLGLPDRDGVDLIRQLRTWTQRPILVLSARSQERQKVDALDAGADDYLSKPFGVDELHARLRVALRHAAQTTRAGASTLRIGDVRIDLETKTVYRAGLVVRLTATEWRLLEALAKRADRVVTSRQLLHEVWGPGYAEQGHYLRIYIRQLRQKLEVQPASPVLLLTETSVGYRLLVQSDGMPLRSAASS
ncbi:response regulator [Rhodoferax sp. AJA081-3]|uniref:response regulator n=1 Tax=Rhodoferax sp. AJA081-3 TaxID=2752316 RepID=UPI001AE03613|nr:response regulator [Rhodoferax sp. AJA081-3]QTN26216.1 response regulator [Rhodoferax sp. AJA081-3]